MKNGRFRLYSLKKYLSLYIYQISSRSGFTIIELLVVLTLIGFVSGVGIFSLINYGNIQAVEETVSKVKSIFDEAKFNAVSSVKLETDSDGNSITCTDDLVSYMVDVVPSVSDPDKVILYMNCESSLPVEVKSFSFPPGLSLGTGVNPLCDDVVYEAVSVNVSALSPLRCDVVIEGFGQTKTITIDLLGNVNIN